MPHLIAQMRELALEDCIEQLRGAHDYLVTAAIDMLGVARHTDPEYWGSDVKRLRVTLPPSRPVLIQQDTHNFAEIVNQLAGLERMLDGLQWFAPRWPGSRVDRCHPSTSSAPGENDIILSNSTGLFRVEVFDIAGGTVTNDKLNKTLRTFGLEKGWVSGRRLLFVSASVAPKILPRTTNGRYHFAPLMQEVRTHVLELVHA